MKRLILYTGKGGTGKSVISCATGIKTSELGYNTLVISADPAHTLSDAFGKKIGNDLEKVMERLWVLQIDPIVEMRKNFSLIQEYIVSVLASRGIDETLAYEIASLPTMTHLFALLKVEEFFSKDVFDVILMDTVPSGEALRYLQFPKILGSVSRKLAKFLTPFTELGKFLQPLIGLPTPSKEVIKSEVQLISRLESLAEILKNSDISSLRLIANPDSFSIENIRRTLLGANLYGINVDLSIINKIIPDKVKDDFFQRWKELQREALEKAKLSLYPLPIKFLELFDVEVKGLDMLKKVAEELFKEEDPTKVYFKGSPFSLEYKGNSLIFRVKVPFTEKDECEVERIGEDLMIKVKKDIGELINFIPLPSVANYMSLKRAKLLKGELEITFVKENGG
ncbi:Arsenical pump-driving ATPase [archaeon HR06]|nr:Arsenical pump-driving ATPase [archaeon HR06]